MAIVPPMAKALSRLAASERRTGMAAAVFYAGAPCDRVTSDEFEGVFETSLFAIYGTTETGGIATSFTGAGKLPGVGRPLRDVDVEIRHHDRYEGLGAGVGEIHVRSSSMMQGYAGAPPKQPIDLWATGDIGTVDSEGSVRIVGRIRDVINLGGMKVDPSDVERVLRSHPSVADVAVYPGLRENDTEFVQAAVQPVTTTIDVEELRRHCLELLDTHKVPLRFHLVETIPRSASGKCLKIQCPDFPRRFIVE